MLQLGEWQEIPPAGSIPKLYLTICIIIIWHVLVANLFMEEFESKVISTSPTTQALAQLCGWHIFIQQAKHTQQFFQHINSIDPHIQSTTETPTSNGFIPSLDTQVTPGLKNTTNLCVWKTHPYWPVPLLGHPPQPFCKIQCVKYLDTQGQHCLYQPTNYFRKRRNTLGKCLICASTQNGP